MACAVIAGRWAAAVAAIANVARAVLRLLMQFAVESELRPDNPAAGLKAYRTGTRHTWTEEELEQFEGRWPLGTRERLAFEWEGEGEGEVEFTLADDDEGTRLTVVETSPAWSTALDLRASALAYA